jgi:hypothetical protein
MLLDRRKIKLDGSAVKQEFMPINLKARTSTVKSQNSTCSHCNKEIPRKRKKSQKKRKID